MASNKIDPRISKIVVDSAEDIQTRDTTLIGYTYMFNERIAEILTWLNDVKLDFDIKTMKPTKSIQPNHILYNGVAKLQVDKNQKIIAPQPGGVLQNIDDIMYSYTINYSCKPELILDNKAVEMFINKCEVGLNFRQQDWGSEFCFYRPSVCDPTGRPMFYPWNQHYAVRVIIFNGDYTVFSRMINDIDGYLFSNGMGRFFDNLQNSVKELSVDPKVFDKMSSYRLKRNNENRDNEMKRRINSFAELIHKTQIKFKSPQDIIEFFDRMIKYNTVANDISAHYRPIKEKDGAMEEVYEQLKFMKVLRS